MKYPNQIFRPKPNIRKAFTGICLLAQTFSLTLCLTNPLSALSAVSPSPDNGQVKVENKLASNRSNLLLRGEIEREQYPQLEKMVHELYEAASEHDTDANFLKGKNSHFNKLISRAWANARDIAELATEYKGFEQSSEAGDVILGETLKIKSKASANYAKQLKRDKLETDISQTLMLLAEGLGTTKEQEKEALTSKAVNSLNDLVGENEAQKALEFMQDWSSSITPDLQFSVRKPWNSLETAQQTKSILTQAIAGDEVVSHIKDVVHKKYNRRSTIARFCAKTLNTSLSIAGYTPTIIGTAAQSAWILYIATQGGPEEAKLLKEVYLAKCLESRCKSLNEYATLAVNSHNMAIARGNSTMLSFSDWMINRCSLSDEPNKLAENKYKPDLADNGVTEIDSANAAASETKSDTKVAEASPLREHKL